jgi:hypothetical protein
MSKRIRLSQAARGYGTGHIARRRRLAPFVATGAVPCARCGELIERGEKWHLDHDDLDRSKYLGASHARCNCATSTHRAEREKRITSRAW